MKLFSINLCVMVISVGLILYIDDAQQQYHEASETYPRIGYSADVEGTWQYKGSSGLECKRSVIGHIYHNSAGDIKLELFIIDPSNKEKISSVYKLFTALDGSSEYWTDNSTTIMKVHMKIDEMGFFENATVPVEILQGKMRRINDLQASGQEAASHSESIGTQTIGNVKALGTRTTALIPKNIIGNSVPFVTTTEEWKSSDLGLIVKRAWTDPIFGNMAITVSNVHYAEPDSKLFMLPSTLKERSVQLPALR